MNDPKNKKKPDIIALLQDMKEQIYHITSCYKWQTAACKNEAKNSNTGGFMEQSGKLGGVRVW